MPSFDEFREDVDATIAAVKTRLPQATITPFDDSGLRQMHAWRASFEDRAERESRFLEAVAPSIVNAPGVADFPHQEDGIFIAAQAQRLRPTFVVLTALAVLYEDPASPYGKYGCPARQVLKPKASYTDGAAYNALADLRQLELLACSGEFADNVALLTEDQWMSLLWCGLRVTQTSIGQQQSKINTSMDPALWPRLPDERRPEVMQRLEQLEASAAHPE